MYPHYERRGDERLSNDLFEAIVNSAAQRVEERVFDKLYIEVGRAVIKKGSMLVGAVGGTYFLINWQALVQWLRLLP